ncbi:hypothetical protein [Alteraurantiacibacter aquimixticola]|uniref:Uncharacterized protein n=1 Tax=Alteraurantiacibacter aquimixticola TaxID=2489173 RepID=A0A4T3F095_9SPHN|nr:hypothetical protein [Alteraurantiacibacter aquimixticola]TIX50449.1 hypothetical protein E5222_09245 [Alteraurantiacibacter aquimixticola]
MAMVVVQILKLGLVGVCLWSLWKGGLPEKFGAALLLSVFVAKRFFAAIGYGIDFIEVDGVHLSLAGLLFACSLALAIQSNRIWPLFFAAFSLIELAGHVAVVITEQGINWAYWGMTQGPIIVQGVTLGLGTLAYLARVRKGVVAREWRQPS